MAFHKQCKCKKISSCRKPYFLFDSLPYPFFLSATNKLLFADMLPSLSYFKVSFYDLLKYCRADSNMSQAGTEILMHFYWEVLSVSATQYLFVQKDAGKMSSHIILHRQFIPIVNRIIYILISNQLVL